jgi:putative oxidoreductase
MERVRNRSAHSTRSLTVYRSPALQLNGAIIDAGHFESQKGIESMATNSFATKWLSILRFVLGFLFIQHGLEKLWGFAGGRIDRDFSQAHAWAGPIEVIGGTLLMLGLFTRPTAFILCGEMAVAYFKSWAPRGFWPIANGGELAVLDCYIYLWLVFAGGGPWSLDAVLSRRKKSVADLTPAGAPART